MEIVIIAIVLFFAYLLLKPQAGVKSKETKQDEIINSYKVKLQKALLEIENKEERTKRKTELLKLYAKELNRNLFLMRVKFEPLSKSSQKFKLPLL